MVVADREASSQSQETVLEAGEMIQWVKVLVTKPDNLNSIPRWIREPSPANCPLTSAHAPWYVHMQTCTHTH